MRRLLPLLLLMACGDPGDPDKQTDYRDPTDTGATSGERGNVLFTEVLWSGSVDASGTWDRSDVFVELKNEGARPVNLSGWHIILQGVRETTWRLPQSDFVLNVGEHAFFAAKTTGCFPEPDWVIEGFSMPFGDPFRLTLRDADERLIDSAGNRDMPPFAGGYDLVSSRSMERIELMFGGRGTTPHMWHFYTETQAGVDVPNNLEIAEGCRTATLASPGRPNSPDYSGAFSSGGFE